MEITVNQSVATIPCISSTLTKELLDDCIMKSESRLDMWGRFIGSSGVRRMAEIGVYRGDFAAGILQRCEHLAAYYMIDPWRHLDDWNKPANHTDELLAQFLEETKTKTDFAASKRIILRGKTTEVIDQIPDGELDFAYVDADHTLKGITIDLIRVYPKLRDGGFLCGDDFSRSIWEHKTTFEPTLVFPFAVYFAEAVGAVIYALPYSQFCIQKALASRFQFFDLTKKYDDVALRNQFSPGETVKVFMRERYPRIMRVAAKAKRLL